MWLGETFRLPAFPVFLLHDLSPYLHLRRNFILRYLFGVIWERGSESMQEVIRLAIYAR